MEDNKLLEVDDISVCYGKLAVLFDVTVNVRKGEGRLSRRQERGGKDDAVSDDRGVFCRP